MCKIVRKKRTNVKDGFTIAQTKKVNDKGSSVIEMCLIMPVIILICFSLITLFLDTINDSIVGEEVYTALYTYSENMDGANIGRGVYERFCESSMGKSKIKFSFFKKKNSVEIKASSPSENAGAYVYEQRDANYETEYGVCTKRLRGWQFYGDTFRE